MLLVRVVGDAVVAVGELGQRLHEPQLAHPGEAVLHDGES